MNISFSPVKEDNVKMSIITKIYLNTFSVLTSQARYRYKHFIAFGFHRNDQKDILTNLFFINCCNFEHLCLEFPKLILTFEGYLTFEPCSDQII